MRLRSGRIAFFVAMLAVVVLAGAAASAQTTPLKPETVAGKYQGTASTANGDMPLAVELRVEKGALVGAITSEIGDIAITGSTITADQVVLNIDMGGAPGTITGTYKDGVYEGSWSLGGNSGSCKLTRVDDKKAAPAADTAAPAAKAAAPAQASDPVTGTWDGVAGDGEMSRNFTLSVKLDGDKVTGDIASDEGSVPLTSGTWKDGALTVAFDFPDVGVITMVGSIKDNKLVGTLDMAGRVQMPWAAVKRGAK